MQTLPVDHRDPGGTDEPAEVADGNSQSRFMRQRHATMLALAVSVVVLAFLLDVPGPDRVALRWLPELPLPQSCMSRQWFGQECPGCGLTRSFVHLAHGGWRSSLAAHRLGWLMAVAVLVQFPYRLAAMVWKREYPLGKRLPSAFGTALVILLIGNWIVGFFL